MAVCTIHTDYVDPTKTEEILQRCTKIISEALRKAPSGTGIPLGANKNINNVSISQIGGDVNEVIFTPVCSIERY